LEKSLVPSGNVSAERRRKRQGPSGGVIGRAGAATLSTPTATAKPLSQQKKIKKIRTSEPLIEIENTDGKVYLLKEKAGIGLYHHKMYLRI